MNVKNKTKKFIINILINFFFDDKKRVLQGLSSESKPNCLKSLKHEVL